MEDVPMPEMGVNDVLIKIKKTAICGTDLHIYKWDDWSRKNIRTPLVIGHEYVGEVVDVGSGVRNVRIGDRVTGEGHIACGHCRNCRRGKLHVCENIVGVGVNRDGAFAEYLSLPAENVVRLDPRISDDMAAIMDPFGNATHTALSFPLIGEDAAEKALKDGACAIYHGCCHNRLYEKSMDILGALYKSAFFVMRVKRWRETGRFVKKLSELALEAAGEDGEILSAFADFRAGRTKEEDFVKLSDALIKWSAGVIRRS